MEGRVRPAPVRREESSRSPAGTEARSYALALKALQDRVATVEADNQQLREKLADAKNHTNREIDRLKARLESEERAKTAEKNSVLKQEIAISAKLREKAEQLAEELEICESRRVAERQELQFQLEFANTELAKTQGKIEVLERELQNSFLPPISPIKAESEDGKRAEEELKREKIDLKRALEESEAARFLLLQHQIKSQAVLDDILRMNDRLVSVLHRSRKGKSLNSPNGH